MCFIIWIKLRAYLLAFILSPKLLLLFSFLVLPDVFGPPSTLLALLWFQGQGLCRTSTFVYFRVCLFGCLVTCATSRCAALGTFSTSPSAPLPYLCVQCEFVRYLLSTYFHHLLSTYFHHLFIKLLSLLPDVMPLQYSIVVSPSYYNHANMKPLKQV